jgi:hypothetical protein
VAGDHNGAADLCALALAVLPPRPASRADDRARQQREELAALAWEAATPSALPAGFPSDGVTVEALRELAARCEPRWTTNEACMLRVKPLTCAPGWRHKPTCVNAEQQWYAHSYVDERTGEETDRVPAGTRSYCELLVEQGKGHQVGRARIFVSHAWKYRFADVLTALEAHVARLKAAADYDGREIYLWFDICTVNEHTGVGGGGDSWASTFKAAVGAIAHTCLVLSPWDDPVVLTRSWCLW